MHVRHLARAAALLLACLLGGPALAPGQEAPSQAASALATPPPGDDSESEVLGTGAALPPARARFEAHLGTRLLARGLPERAAESFRKVTLTAPGHPGGWYLLARAQQRQGDLAGALQSSQRAVRVLEGLPPGRRQAFPAGPFHRQLGSLLAGTGRLREAEPALRRAVELDPGSAEGHRARGSVQLDLGLDVEAVASLEAAVERDETSADSWLGLSKALLRLDRLDEAGSALARAGELAPEESQVHYTLASLHRARGDLDAQEASLERFQALRDASEQRKAEAHEVDELLRRAAQFQAQEDCEGAGPLLEEALAHPAVADGGFRRTRVLTDLARCRAAGGDAAAAREMYERALEDRPGAFLANFELGTLLAKEGHVERAMPMLVRASAVNPFDYAAHVNLSLGFARIGRLNDALAEVRKAAALQPEDLAVRQLLVDLEWTVGHRLQARAIVERLGGVNLPGADGTTGGAGEWAR